MAGHSHWANIAHKKGRADKVRGKLFGKLSRAIIVAAQRGGDPDMNLALRYAIDKARKNSMPRDNIERAIKKGTGESGGVAYEELLYEGYGPAGVAIMCDILTDNRNRTASEVRKIFEVRNGNLGATGCVSWMFERKGIFIIPADSIEEEALMDLALEAGADDVKTVEGSYEVYCQPEDFQAVEKAIEAADLKPTLAEISRIPSDTVELDASDAVKVLKLIDSLEENDDIQSVTSNFNIPDEIMEQIAAEA